MSKALKVLVINTKGGAGKSTVCMQLVAPFLFTQKQEEVVIYEFDDENRESRSFGGSRIARSHRVHVDKKDLRDEVTEILINDETLCIDVGANKTSATLLSAIIDSGMIYRLDLVVIPLMDGEIDASNAIEIYKLLKESSPELSVVFVLGRVNVARELVCQFDLFLGDQRGLFNQVGLIEEVQEGDRDFILFHDTDAIKYSRVFGVTIWELAQINADLDDQLRTAILNNEDPQKIRFLSFKRSLKKDCVKYFETTLKPAFEILEAKLRSKL